MHFPYGNLKKSDLRYRNSLGISPEIKDVTGGAAYSELEKIRKLYNIIFAKQIHLLKQVFFDEETFTRIANHVNNKIKVSSTGVIYINVYDKIKFDPKNDHGDVYRLWTKDMLKFLELKEYIRSEIWDVARNKWEEKAKTYLLDNVGTFNIDLTGNEWKKIKNTNIKIKSVINVNAINSIIKRKKLIKICQKLQTQFCYFDVDNFILISEKTSVTKWKIKNDFSEIELIEGDEKDTTKYILYLIQSCNFLIKNFQCIIKTENSKFKLWHRLLLGFQAENFNLLNQNFYNYVLLNYPKDIFNFIKIKNNQNFFAYINLQDLNSKYSLDYINDKSFRIQKYYLIGKEYLVRLNNIPLILDKLINIYNIENILDLQKKYFQDNVFTVDYSTKIL